ncbi:General substrate transporter [Pleurostoma richardsiae]|uniref:General substrate transporter n=1 Tax=Pleurostoma richardsiae TaxID=41990 RepID=A0AA38R6E4_9PEZI|nr:General substrate transporter [Pleurostoma richardsiae]
MATVPVDWTEIQPEKKWSILRKQRRFALWALYTSIGSMMMGFDFSLAGTATAFPAFQRVMGVPYPSQASGYLIPAYIQSSWSGVSTAGDIVGVLISGQLMDRIGRKYTILVGTILTAVGVGIQVASHEWKLFLGGRLVNAIGFGMVFVIAPVWIGENVRPELRGLFLCFTNGSIVLGQFVLALVAYGVQKINSDWSFRSLIIIQYAFVVPLLLGWPFFPESPYFLLEFKNDTDGARKSLRRVHGSTDHSLIDAEIVRIQGCFKGPHLKRTLTAVLPAAAQQFIGAGFVLSYVTYFLDLLGVKQYFTVSVVLYVCMLLSNLSAFTLIEVSGRRPLILYGMIALTLIELLMGIMGVVDNAGAIWLILVCIFLWAIVYQVSIGAVGFAVAVEIPTPSLRPTTVSLVGLVQGICLASGWVIGFVSPYMINPDEGNMGAKVGFVFAGLGVFLCIAVFFMIPETKGLSYNDLDRLFAERVNPRYFQREILLLREHPVDKETSREDAKEAGSQTIHVETAGDISV